MNFARMYQVNAHHVSEFAFHQIPLRRGPRGVAQGGPLLNAPLNTYTLHVAGARVPGGSLRARKQRRHETSRGTPPEADGTLGAASPEEARSGRTSQWRRRVPGARNPPGRFPGGASPRVRIGAARLWLRLSTGVGCLASFQDKLRLHVKTTLRFLKNPPPMF